MVHGELMYNMQQIKSPVVYGNIYVTLRPYLIDSMFHEFPSENCDPGGR